MSNEIRIKAILDDKISGGLDKIHDKFTTISKGKGFESVIQGVGVGLGVSAYGALDRAVTGVVDVFGEAIHAAIEDQASRARLTQSLKENAKAFDGNTSAIEESFKAGIKLGFSDDEQASSLAKVVAATHDVGEALHVMSVAQDLARFKNISLEEASQALVKVEAGSYRALKALGIQLRVGATQTEALAAVEKVANGQAETFAATTGGKLVIAQTKWNETLERLGYTLLPVVTTGLDDLSTAMDVASGDAQVTGDGFVAFGQQLLGIVAGPFTAFEHFMFGLGHSIGEAFDPTPVDNFADGTIDDMERARGSISSDLESVDQKLADSKAAADAYAHKWDDAAGKIIRSGNKITSQLAKDAQDLIDGYFDPIEEHIANNETHFQTLADIQTRESAKGAKAINTANAAIIQDIDDQATALNKLGDQHKLTKGDVDRYEKDVTAAYAAMGQKVPAEVQKQINILRILDGEKPKPHVNTSDIDRAKQHIDAVHNALNNLPDKTNIKVILTVLQQLAGRGAQHAEGEVGIIRHAAGDVGLTNGPMVSPDGGVMGEAGTEAYAILRNPRRIAADDFGGGAPRSLTVNFNSVWPPTPAQAREIARIVDEASYRDLRRAAALSGRV